jgi:hypothetical protein
MSLKQTHYPHGGDKFPWGILLITIAIIGGAGYLGYKAFKLPELNNNPKSNENERK